MSKLVLALALMIAVNASFLSREDATMFKFMKFVQQHSKEYSTVEEFHAKFEVFKHNLRRVDDHETFSPFMDVTEEEFKSFLTLDASKIPENQATAEMYKLQNIYSEVPAEHDWRAKGAVGPVKNQGSCGSCWAFSTIANIEGLYAIKNGKYESFSEQELVDCDTVDHGCNGGLMTNAFTWLKNKGVENDANYPYHGRKETCHFDAGKATYKVTGYKNVSKNEEEILKVLYETGPLSIAVDATDFQTYTKGIKRTCNFRGLNHGVALVGYGEENGVKYWVVRNSWGKGWGEQGYIRLERGKGLCGLNSDISTATIE